MRRVWLAPLGLVLGAAGALLWVGWRWVTPYPVKGGGSAESIGVDVKEVSFLSLDRTRLHGLWLAGRKGYPTVVLCHGYFKSLAEPFDVGVALNEAGYNVFLFDFRACGRSGGRFTTIGYKETWDVQAAVRFVSERYGRGPVGVLGISMGAAAAIIAAAQMEEIAAVVADSAYAHLEGVMRKKLPDFAPVRWMAPVGWISVLIGEAMAGGRLRRVRPVEYVGRISPRPLLFVHGERDSYIPAEQTGELFEAAGE
ncbi:MAG: alpha/beta fold hydrolase, partial [Chloroflexi bacterium]|nr:alpha/beta fold hydrolase [Chloroflexota bacterium]